MGSWLVYGLGSESENLPGFVVLTSTGAAGQSQPIAPRQWHSGFLPSRFQGVQFRVQGRSGALRQQSRPASTRDRQRDVVDAVRHSIARKRVVDDPEIATRISSVRDGLSHANLGPGADGPVGREPKETLDLYGASAGDGSFASNCLLARRLAERGVRFIQLYHRDWDHHGGIKNDMKFTAGEVDQGRGRACFTI